eukprot:scaffold2157_cov376-Prasinococcus_capsulatus_cf.AAC.13
MVNEANPKCTMVVSIVVPFSRRNPFRKRIERASIEESRESYELWLKLAQRHIHKLKSSKVPKWDVHDRRAPSNAAPQGKHEDIRASLLQLPPENRRKIEEMLKLNVSQDGSYIGERPLSKFRRRAQSIIQNTVRGQVSSPPPIAGKANNTHYRLQRYWTILGRVISCIPHVVSEVPARHVLSGLCRLICSGKFLMVLLIALQAIELGWMFMQLRSGRHLQGSDDWLRTPSSVASRAEYLQEEIRRTEDYLRLLSRQLRQLDRNGL